MSASPMPFLVPKSSPQRHQDRSELTSRTRTETARMVRRRPNMAQGRALETLGHAIEYLVDSRMFLVGEPHTIAERDAVQILSRSSREVFATCAEVVPVTDRVRHWAAERLGIGSLEPLGQAPTRRV